MTETTQFVLLLDIQHLFTIYDAACHKDHIVGPLFASYDASLPLRYKSPPSWH